MTTEIIYLNIDPEKNLGDRSTEAGQRWAASLDLIETVDGFRRLYWGRRLEEPEKVQLHIEYTWPVFPDNRSLQDQFKREILPLWIKLTGNPSDISIRHTNLTHQALENPFEKSLLGYPVGTAIYKGTDAAWHEGAWPLWTHVVRHVDGCRGIAGGSIEEPVEGVEKCYLVYVAWESVKHHDDYHHTEHFRKHFVILNIGHKGYAEYGHVIFKEIREAKGEGTKL